MLPVYIILSLLLAVWASPAAELGNDPIIPVSRIQKTSSKFSGLAARQYAFKKHGWTFKNTVPKGAKYFRNHLTNISYNHATVPQGQSGLIPSAPEPYHAEYLSPVIIGGNQTLMLNFDSGSSDLWVFSTYLHADVRAGHSAFNASKSTTFHSMPGFNWSILYGDGSEASGIVGTDTVNVGGATVTSQAVELATSVSDSFMEDTNNDGLLGLGFPYINTVKPKRQIPFFQSLLPSLSSPTFTVDFREDSSGTITFGRIPTAKFTGALRTILVNPYAGFWQFWCPTFAVGNKLYAVRKDANPAIADTGTSLLLADDAAVVGYYNNMTDAAYSFEYGGFVAPCDGTWPTFGVVMGYVGGVITIPSSRMKYAQVDGNFCYGALQSNEGQPLQIMGDVMFRSSVVVFNASSSGPTLSWAPKAS